jgi:hypothetical protein
MRKLFIFILLLSSAAIHAQLSEDFEGETFPPTGWTSYQTAGCKGYWASALYATDAVLKSKVLNTFSNGGLKCAKVISSSLNNSGKVNPNSWLITPKISVSTGNKLHFMLGYNGAYNGSSTVADGKKFTFQIVISTTTADTTAFNDVVYTKVYTGVKSWSDMCIDLSQYAGKDIYVAFHEFGYPQATPFINNTLYIDNVKVNSDATSDLLMTEAASLSSGAIATQPVKVKVMNSGIDVSSFKLAYQCGTDEPVRETVNQTLKFGEETSYTFNKNITLPANGVAQTVKVWCEGGNADPVHENDTLSSTATVFENATLPYTMGSTASTDFTSSYSKTSGVLKLGWSYMAKLPAWVYTSSTVSSYLYTNKSYALKKGKMKIKMFCTATDIGATMEAYLFKVKGEYGNPVGSLDLKQSLDASWQNFYVDIPEDGDYIIALKAKTDGQVALFGLTFCYPYDDIVATQIIDPASKTMIAQKDVPLTVRFSNDGIQKMTNIPVKFKLDDGAVVSETINAIDSLSYVDYTFTNKLDLSKQGNHNLTVWANLSTDGDMTNDTIKTSIHTYQVQAFPYKTSFENESDKDLWTSYNIDNDDTYWGIEATGAYSVDGTHAAFINYETPLIHKDFWVSPAVKLEKGVKARVAFYYGNTTVYGGSHLKVILTKTLDPDSILAKGTVLGDVAITTKSYKYFAAPVDVPETGNYYIAIYNYGGMDAIFLDKFALDAATEVSLEGISSSITGGSYDIENPEITASIKNCGVTDITGGSISLALYQFVSNNQYKLISAYKESFNNTLAAGEAMDYTLKTKPSIPGPGAYIFKALLSQPQDEDSINNSFACVGPTFYETKTVPYVVDFETAADRAALSLTGKWVAGAGSTPYEGSALMQHSGAAQENGDWAFLNRVNLKPGTYDFSFFWKTMTNNTNENMSQNFSVYIGTEASPDAMTTLLYDKQDALSPDHKATKVLMPLTITTEGNYFIGVKCTTTNSLGVLNMDYFTIKEPATGISLPEGDIYKADYANNESEWYHYYPTRTSSQWRYDETNKCMTTDRILSSITNAWTTPGLYESPAFKFNKGDIIYISYKYSMAAGDGLTLNGNSKLNLLSSTVDVPDSFKTVILSGDESYLADKSATYGTAATAVEIPQNGVYYFGFMPESDQTTNFKLYSFELSMVTVDGINSQRGAANINYSFDGNNILHISSDYTKAEIYTSGGALAAVYSNQSDIDLNMMRRGVHEVRIVSAKGTATFKIMIK